MRWNGTNLCQVKCSPPATSGFKILHVLVRWQVCYVGFDPLLYRIIAGMVSAQQSPVLPLALPVGHTCPMSSSSTVPTVWERAAVAWLPCLSLRSKFNPGGGPSRNIF